jgi:hypothetical protein
MAQTFHGIEIPDFTPNSETDTPTMFRLRYLRDPWPSPGVKGLALGARHPVVKAAWDARLEEVLAESTPADAGLYYLSFVDSVKAASIPLDQQRPGGPSWLGACYVTAPSFMEAIGLAHQLGINPGGEVASVLVPFEVAVLVDPKWRNRLLDQAELAEMDAEMARALRRRHRGRL